MCRLGSIVTGAMPGIIKRCLLSQELPLSHMATIFEAKPISLVFFIVWLCGLIDQPALTSNFGQKPLSGKKWNTRTTDQQWLDKRGRASRPAYQICLPKSGASPYPIFWKEMGEQIWIRQENHFSQESVDVSRGIYHCSLNEVLKIWKKLLHGSHSGLSRLINTTPPVLRACCKATLFLWSRFT